MDAFPKQGFDWSSAVSVTSYGPDDPEPAPSPDRMDHLYRMGEAIFRVVGPKLVENGWSCFPQERTERRGPGKCGRATIRWKPYQERLPSAAEVADWGLENPGHNAAIITGAASSGVFVIDVDCDGDKLAWAIRELAKSTMPTPFIRVGRAPRFMLVYRLPAGGEMSKEAIRFAETDANGKTIPDERNAIEILAGGTPWTAYGKHHKTGRYFKWIGTSEPMHCHVSEVPVVSRERVQAFIRACGEIKPIYRRPSAPSSPGAIMSPAQGAYYRPSNAGGTQVVIPEIGVPATGGWKIRDSVVVDGREAYLYAWCRALVCANEEIVVGNRDQLLVEIAQQHADVYVHADGKRDRDNVNRDVREKVVRHCNRGRSTGEHRLWFTRPTRGASGRLETPAAHQLPNTRPDDGSLEWLGEGDVGKFVSGWSRIAKTSAPVEIPGAREERALLADRSEVSQRIATGIDDAIGGFLSDVESAVGRVHIIPAPTGAGKTSRVIPQLVRYLKEHPPKEREEPRPIIVLAPTHENLASMRALAEAAGASFEEGVDGLNAVVFGGKLWSGCMRADDVALLQRSGIGSSGLCSAKNRQETGDGDEELVVERCRFYDLCGYQRMRERAATSRLILAPRTFLTQRSVPKELSNPLAVVIDESVVHELVAVSQMPIASLSLKRAETVLTKREKEEGLDHGFLAAGKDKAARIAGRALAEGRDVAVEFLSDPALEQHLRDAKRVCDSAMTVVRDITPGTTSFGVAELTASPMAVDLPLETRFWSVVLDRVENLKLDRNSPLMKHGKPRARARGARDARIQARREVVGLQEVEMVRVSWRPRRHWDGVPTLLTDASSDERIVEHLFSAEVVRSDLDVPLDLRVIAAVDATHSPSSYCPAPGATRKRRSAAAQLIDGTQRVVAHVAAQYGWGRTLVIAAKRVRPVLFDKRVCPTNVDQAHFGAMRGLDQFKDHVASIVVGRTEQPVWVVDGLVGALTFDMDEPEYPLDALGTGIKTDGQPAMRIVQPRTIRMRSGHDTTVGVPEMPGEFGRRLDRQWREEETRQALGRLRPVHASATRWETPVAVILSSCVPEGLIVDEITDVADLLSSPSVWVGEAARESHGVLCPRITPLLSGHSAERVKEFVDNTVGRATWGFTPLTWTDTAGVTSDAYVLTHFEDPGAALFDALERSGLAVTAARVVIGEPSKPRVDGQIRGEDKVSALYMTEDQRAERDRLFTEWLDLRGNPEALPNGLMRAMFEMEAA